MIAHIKWAKGHRRTVAGDVWTDDLARRGSIVLELYSLISDVSSSCCNRIRGVVCFSFTSICRGSYCENIDKEVVVAVVSITRSISIFSTIELAALSITSSEKSEPAVVIVKTESVSARPPDVAEVCVILSPDHFCNLDPYTVVTISSVIS